MSRKSEIIAHKRAKNMLYFYGRGVEWTKTKQKWVHYQSDDFIIIATQNVKCFKNGQWVLVVGNNKIVNLKDFQIRAIKNWAVKENAYAVRLTRQYFHVKTLSFTFTDTAFEKDQTWWDLVELAKVQDNEQLWWKDGHYDCLKDY